MNRRKFLLERRYELMTRLMSCRLSSNNCWCIYKHNVADTNISTKLSNNHMCKIHFHQSIKACEEAARPLRIHHTHVLMKFTVPMATILYGVSQGSILGLYTHIILTYPYPAQNTWHSTKDSLLL